MQQPDKQREAFEAWYGENYSQYALKTWREWKYDNLDTELAWQAWQAAQKAQWQPIETLPVDQLLSTREMFVVRGFGIVGVSSAPYNTDAYAVWLESDCGCCYKFVRWKHNFQPTHWMPLPQGPNVVD